jgi:hypothetical protein
MPTSKSFAYNPGSPIAGTDQVGDLAISVDNQDYTTSPGGVTWWQGPDEEIGYVIAHTVPGNTQPTPVPEDAITLSGTYKGPNINLSNNNQTAFQQFGYQMSGLAETLISGTDKIMFSIYYTTLTPTTLPESRFIGVGKTTMNYQGSPYGGYPGNDDKSIGFNAIGEYYYNGSVVSSELPTWGDGDTIDIVISHGQYWWIRVNGGNWNNNPAANPTTLTGGLTMNSLTNYYPALCPGYEGTMTILNYPRYGVPADYNFLGNITGSVGFNRAASLTEASFIEVANSVSGQVFASGNAASTWLTDNGYWNSWTSFGSSGFQWMTINSVTSTTAAGIGQNSITVSITQSGGGMEITNGMYSPATFPEEYGVPFDGNQILNQNSGIFTATFSEPVTDALVGFASIGNPGTQVPIIVSAPFTPIWSTATTFQSPASATQYTQLTGTEGFCIIRIDGTVSSVTFNYTASEYYCNVCFGFVDQNV